jgi:hypothetical protein
MQILCARAILYGYVKKLYWKNSGYTATDSIQKDFPKNNLREYWNINT